MQGAFETLLNQKMNSNNLCPANVGSSVNHSALEFIETSPAFTDFRYSVTRIKNSYSGILTVDSNAGKLFATAVAEDLISLTKSLSEQVARQLEIYQLQIQNFHLAV